MEQGDPDREFTNRFQAIRRTFIMRNGLTPQEAEALIAKNYEKNQLTLKPVPEPARRQLGGGFKFALAQTYWNIFC